MSLLVVDTDIFIDHLRGFKPAANIFADIENGKISAVISSVTLAELFSGRNCESKERLDAVENIIRLALVEVVSDDIAKKSGALRRKYGIGLLDAIIAATAIKRSAALLTRNVKDFSKVSEIKVKIPY